MSSLFIAAACGIVISHDAARSLVVDLPGGRQEAR